MKGIITLCGPTKFYKTFDDVSLKLTLADYAIFSLGSHRGQDNSLKNPQVNGHKEQLERLHKEKIDLSDAIVVINQDGYVGESTQSEIDYAEEHGIMIYWYEQNKPNWFELLRVGRRILL